MGKDEERVQMGSAYSDSYLTQEEYHKKCAECDLRVAMTVRMSQWGWGTMQIIWENLGKFSREHSGCTMGAIERIIVEILTRTNCDFVRF